jgi:hypothetical protein
MSRRLPLVRARQLLRARASVALASLAVALALVLLLLAEGDSNVADEDDVCDDDGRDGGVRRVPCGQGCASAVASAAGSRGR